MIVQLHRLIDLRHYPVIVVVVVVAVVEVVVDVHQGVDGEEDEGKEGEGVEACLRGTAGGLAGPRLLSLRGQEVGHQAGDSLHLLPVRDCGSRRQSGVRTLNTGDCCVCENCDTYFSLSGVSSPSFFRQAFYTDHGRNIGLEYQDLLNANR